MTNRVSPRALVTLPDGVGISMNSAQVAEVLDQIARSPRRAPLKARCRSTIRFQVKATDTDDNKDSHGNDH